MRYSNDRKLENKNVIKLSEINHDNLLGGGVASSYKY